MVCLSLCVVHAVVRGTGKFIRAKLPVLCSFRRLQKYPQHGVASGGYSRIARVRVTILGRIKQPTTTGVCGHCAVSAGTRMDSRGSLASARSRAQAVVGTTIFCRREGRDVLNQAVSQYLHSGPLFKKARGNLFHSVWRGQVSHVRPNCIEYGIFTVRQLDTILHEGTPQPGAARAEKSLGVA